ncbi:hypothetical protein ColTof3_13394 [Colletotrichum tofieldiae]|nr:hypothetical protein ColTof3_13394 [Colletotrichum tofieldiae]
MRLAPSTSDSSMPPTINPGTISLVPLTMASSAACMSRPRIPPSCSICFMLTSLLTEKAPNGPSWPVVEMTSGALIVLGSMHDWSSWCIDTSVQLVRAGLGEHVGRAEAAGSGADDDDVRLGVGVEVGEVSSRHGARDLALADGIEGEAVPLAEELVDLGRDGMLRSGLGRLAGGVGHGVVADGGDGGGRSHGVSSYGCLFFQEWS